jgi:hypothetical protein
MSGEVYSQATMSRSWVRRFVSDDDRERRLRRAVTSDTRGRTRAVGNLGGSSASCHTPHLTILLGSGETRSIVVLGWVVITKTLYGAASSQVSPSLHSLNK